MSGNLEARRLARCAAVVFILIAGPARAHLLNMTEAVLEVAADGEARLLLDLDLTREFGSDRDYFAFSRTPAEEVRGKALALRWARLADAIELQQEQRRVPLRWSSVVPPEDFTLEDFQSPFVWPRTRVVLGAKIDRSQPLQLVFTNRFRFEEPIAVRMIDLTSDLKRSRWLVANQRSPQLPLGIVEVEAPPPIWTDLWSYARAGFLHILPLGVDHLLFVLLLFLASRTVKHLVGQISVFTIAHSITLIIASYRVIEPAAGVVEPLIALSIVWVALENLWFPQVAATRYAVIFGFGLLHGMGFAGALADLELPREHFLSALLTFNLGVEAGQLTFVALMLILLGSFRGNPLYHRRVVVPLSSASGLLAAFWVVQRLQQTLGS